MHTPASTQGAWLSPWGHTPPPAKNSKPRRLARPLWGPDLAILSALGQKPSIKQNKTLQGQESNARPENATEAQPKLKLANFLFCGSSKGQYWAMKTMMHKTAFQGPWRAMMQLCTKVRNTHMIIFSHSPLARKASKLHTEVLG